MKKIIAALSITFIIVLTGCSASKLSNPKTTLSLDDNSVSSTSSRNNLNELQKNGLKIIKEQSFPVELENWGKVGFISSMYPKDGI